MISKPPIQLVLCPLDVPDATIATLRAYLSVDELERADRYRRESDRTRFIVARGRLRQVLANYFAFHPATLQFGYEDRGKPFLKTFVREPLHFNISHSHGLALIAVSETSPVGVDLEYAKDDLDATGLARRFFSPAEHSAIIAAPDDAALRRRFYTCWTRKEAFVKAIGSGIVGGLDTFDTMTPDSPDAPAALFAHRTEPVLVTRWALRDLTLPPGYFGALCAHAPITAAPILTLP